MINFGINPFNSYILNSCRKDYLENYLKIKEIKFKFFKQHDLWKYKKMLIKLFEYPDTIEDADLFLLKLNFLENIIKLKGR